MTVQCKGSTSASNDEEENIYVHVDLLESSDLCCLCSEGLSDSVETKRTFTTDSICSRNYMYVHGYKCIDFNAVVAMKSLVFKLN